MAAGFPQSKRVREGAQDGNCSLFVTSSCKWQSVTFAHIQGEGIIEWHEYEEVESLRAILEAAHRTQCCTLVVTHFTSLERTEGEEKGEALKSKTPVD